MVPVNGQQGWGREEGRKRPSVGTGPSSCLGSLPDAKQSNALLILITEMILIRTGARATLPPFREGPHREGDGGREVTKKGACWRTNTPALCLSSTSSSTTSSLLKATFPEGPFHLSVFNYVKWIPWEKEKWRWWWALTEEEEKERERGKGVVGGCALPFSVSDSQFCQQLCPFQPLLFLLGWIFFLCAQYAQMCVCGCVRVCPALSGQMQWECGRSTKWGGEGGQNIKIENGQHGEVKPEQFKKFGHADWKVTEFSKLWWTFFGEIMNEWVSSLTLHPKLRCPCLTSWNYYWIESLAPPKMCDPPHQYKHNQGSYCKWDYVGWFLKCSMFQHQMSGLFGSFLPLVLQNGLHLIWWK